MVNVAAEEIRIIVGAATDVGGRPENEDSVLVTDLPAGDDEGGLPRRSILLAVADGMGGYQRGEVASRLAVDTVNDVFTTAAPDTTLALKQAFRRANEVIFADAEGAGDDNQMGTTLVVAVVRGRYVTVGSVGDSRAYLIRASRLTQITQDHSLVAEQVSQGTLTAEQARESPQRNIITQALGHRPALDRGMPSVFELTLLPEDRLLLCTDGFYDVIPDDDFVHILLNQEPDDAAKRLVELAVSRGTTDNVSAVIAQVMPSRATIERELVAPEAPSRAGTVLVPVLIVLGVILFIAIVLLALLVV